MGSNTFVQADIWTVAQTDHGNVVLVRPKESDLVIPIFVNPYETQAILIGLGNLEMPRPMTHDLLISIINTLEASVTRIEIYDIVDKTFHAHIILNHNGLETEIEARPSDAMALSVRCNADVYISEDIIESTGMPIEMLQETPENGTITSFQSGGKYTGDCSSQEKDFDNAQNNYSNPQTKSKSETFDSDVFEIERNELTKELEEAIEVEDYEKAAIIRDKLQDLGF